MYITTGMGGAKCLPSGIVLSGMNMERPFILHIAKHTTTVTAQAFKLDPMKHVNSTSSITHVMDSLVHQMLFLHCPVFPCVCTSMDIDGQHF